MLVRSSRNSETPASCGNRTGGVAGYRGADLSIVPNSPPRVPHLGDVRRFSADA